MRGEIKQQQLCPKCGKPINGKGCDCKKAVEKKRREIIKRLEKV